MQQNPTTAGVRIAVFASRETPEILHRAITAASAAAPSGACIDVLVNGNAELAERIAAIARRSSDESGPIIRIFAIAIGDKANAWNQHIQRICGECSIVFYMDGYVRPSADSFRHLLMTMQLSDGTLGGTGVPTSGRSASAQRKELLSEGGFHGNLCCIRGHAVAEMRRRGIAIPLGIYRTDSTLGAFLAFGLNPVAFPWSPKRFIAVDQNATWEVDKKHWWRTGDIRSSIKRRARQARGKIENQAVKAHLAVLGRQPEELPKTVKTLIEKWLRDFPEESRKFIGYDPMLRRSLLQLLEEREWNETDLLPRLVWERSPQPAEAEGQ